jgi:hypothetical protein
MLMRKQTYRLKEIVYTIAYMVLASGQRVDDEGEDLVHGLPIRPRLHPLEPEVHDLALPSAVGRGRASVAVSATWNGRRRASVSAASRIHAAGDEEAGCRGRQRGVLLLPRIRGVWGLQLGRPRSGDEEARSTRGELRS